MSVRIRITVLLAALIMAAAPQVSGQAQPPTMISPLDLRVTIEFRSRPALDVLRTLSEAAALTPDFGPGALLPVTIALTNVRLETALTAVCENAGCAWELRDRRLKVTPMPIAAGLTLPRAVSIALSDASTLDVFRALATALNLELSIEGELPDRPVSIKFNNAAPAAVLNFLAQNAQCAWQIEPGRLTVRRLR
jgi:hypothetical protein